MRRSRQPNQRGSGVRPSSGTGLRGPGRAILSGPHAAFLAVALPLTLVVWACATEGEIDQPAPLYGEMPIEYPLHMWDRDMEGETLLRVRVTDTGGVDSVEVLESSGHPSFDSAAVAGARDLRFSPARRDGKRIEVWAKVPVHFSKRPRPDTLGF